MLAVTGFIFLMYVAAEQLLESVYESDCFLVGALKDKVDNALFYDF